MWLQFNVWFILIEDFNYNSSRGTKSLYLKNNLRSNNVIKKLVFVMEFDKSISRYYVLGLLAISYNVKIIWSMELVFSNFIQFVRVFRRDISFKKIRLTFSFSLNVFARLEHSANVCCSETSPDLSVNYFWLSILFFPLKSS